MKIWFNALGQIPNEVVKSKISFSRNPLLEIGQVQACGEPRRVRNLLCWWVDPVDPFKSPVCHGESHKITGFNHHCITIIHVAQICSSCSYSSGVLSARSLHFTDDIAHLAMGSPSWAPHTSGEKLDALTSWKNWWKNTAKCWNMMVLIPQSWCLRSLFPGNFCWRLQLGVKKWRATLLEATTARGVFSTRSAVSPWPSWFS